MIELRRGRPNTHEGHPQAADTPSAGPQQRGPALLLLEATRELTSPSRRPPAQDPKQLGHLFSLFCRVAAQDGLDERSVADPALGTRGAVQTTATPHGQSRGATGGGHRRRRVARRARLNALSAHERTTGSIPDVDRRRLRLRQSDALGLVIARANDYID